MTSSQSLATLRQLQALRQQRCEADHARSVIAGRNAADEAKSAMDKLTSLNAALDEYAAKGELQIEQFQIFAQLITQSEIELQSRHEALKEASEREASERRMRLQAERQSEQLADRYSEALTKERRKAEDRKSREFLSQAARSNGARI
ncbi:MAG: hypothetical protein AAGI28_06145 [Pseudomonadota bacterium]